MIEVKVVAIGGSADSWALKGLKGSASLAALKKQLAGQDKRFRPERFALRLEPKGKNLSDSDTLDKLGLGAGGGTLYAKDLGPQIGWKTVFLAEYAGPVAVYWLVALQPSCLYSDPSVELSLTAKIAVLCWSAHYIKRILETVFVHRFSHATMPLRNLFKNCTYYWMFTFYVAYHVCHPLYTSPGPIHVLLGLIMFIVCELGNLSIHLALRDLRPAGSTVRKIPKPTSNVFTKLFDYVSCPNYAYEFGSWLGFSYMTHCIPAFIFALAGMYQMTVWAIGKHRNYKKEFSNYPKNRKAILPYLI